MPYPQHDINRIVELIKEIESRKEHPNAAATYKDVPALQEIDRIVNAQLVLQPCDRDIIKDSIGAMRYLGTAYEYMWRIAYATGYYKRLLQLQAELFKRFGENDENCNDDYVNAHINNISFPKTIEQLEEFIYEHGCYNVEDVTEYSFAYHSAL